jgi:HK97 family phage major capsid protein
MSLEALITARANAYEKINTIREQWKDKEIPSDVMAELQGAADEMTRLKPLIDNATKSKAIFNQFGPDSVRNDNPDRSFDSTPAPRNHMTWNSPRANGMRQADVRIPTRTMNRKVKNKYAEPTFDEQATAGFQKLVENNFKITGPDPDIDAYYQAHERYNNTYKISDPERAGTFTVPEEFWTGILKNIDDRTYIQSLATVMNISAQSLAVRMRTAKASMIGPGEELSDAQTNIENALRYGKRVLTPKFHTGALRISNALLRDSSINILSYIQEEISIDVSEYLEDLYLKGTGAAGPVGLLTAATAGEGIDTSRDVNLGSGVFTAETLINCRYALKDTYARNSSWMLHRLMLAAIAQLKGSDGHPLWRASLVPNVPDMLLGRPLIINEFMPYATTADSYGILLGDFSKYWIVFKDLMTMQVQSELYSNTNETGYIYRTRLDAQPILAEAFVRGKFVS